MKMTKVTYKGKTLEIPEGWMHIATQGTMKRDNLSFEDATLAVIKHWFEQQELEDQFNAEHNR